MANYSPSNNSLEHLEFTNITQSVAIVNQELHQWKVQQITGYSTSNGVTFPDLKFTVNDPVNGSQSWSYSSLFEYAVDRHVYYTVLSDDQMSLSYGDVNNLTNLPEVYDNLYKSDPPAESMTVTMHLKGLQRTGHESTSTDSQGNPTTSIVWSGWSDWTDNYTITITTNLDKHMQLLRHAIQQQRFVKNSTIKPEW